MDAFKGMIYINLQFIQYQNRTLLYYLMRKMNSQNYLQDKQNNIVLLEYQKAKLIYMYIQKFFHTVKFRLEVSLN